MQANDPWNKFLNPEVLKQNLLQGGLFLSAFEMLKDSLIGKPRDFYCFPGIVIKEDAPDLGLVKYRNEVLSLHKHSFTAHALWWHNRDALSNEDLEILTQIRVHRDQIAHNMPKMIMTADHNVDLELLSEINRILAKVDNWWLQNFEAAIDPERFEEFSQEDMDEARSMSSIFLSMMLPIATGDDSQFRTLYELWCEHRRNTKTAE